MINAYIQGSYVRLDGKLAGIQGESMSRTLRLNFSPEWGELTKRILWLDARGKQVVSQPLVASVDEVLENNGLVIPVMIPGEALQYDGKTVFIVEGAGENGAISLSAMAEMTVNPNDFYGKNAINATEPTPTEMQQLQASIEEAIGVAAADKQAAQAAAAAAAQSEAAAEDAAGTAIENANQAGRYAAQADGAKAAAEKAALDASGAADTAVAAKTAAETAKTAAQTAKSGAEAAREGAETAQRTAESYTNNPPLPSDNGNWQVWNGEKYVDSGKPAVGASGFSPEIAVSAIVKNGKKVGYNLTIMQKEAESGEIVSNTIMLENGVDGANGKSGDSATISVSEIPGGHMVTITNTKVAANGTTSTTEEYFKVMDGEDGVVVRFTGSGDYNATVNGETVTEEQLAAAISEGKHVVGVAEANMEFIYAPTGETFAVPAGTMFNLRIPEVGSTESAEFWVEMDGYEAVLWMKDDMWFGDIWPCGYAIMMTMRGDQPALLYRSQYLDNATLHEWLNNAIITGKPLVCYQRNMEFFLPDGSTSSPLALSLFSLTQNTDRNEIVLRCKQGGYDYQLRVSQEGDALALAEIDMTSLKVTVSYPDRSTQEYSHTGAEIMAVWSAGGTVVCEETDRGVYLVPVGPVYNGDVLKAFLFKEYIWDDSNGLTERKYYAPSDSRTVDVG